MLDYGNQLRHALHHEDILPLIGVYDVFSATLAAKHYSGLFLSGFGFAASYYGMPDIGFIAWPDMVAYVQRIRAVLPEHHLLVDMDDGYVDVETACHTTRLLESAGASGIVLEDQQRPRRCGHVDGKQILPLSDYLVKLERVLGARRTDMIVIARTDATDVDEIFTRVKAFEAAGADLVLVDAVRDWEIFAQLRAAVSCPLVFNQIAGGKSPRASLSKLKSAGVQAVIYSTPCLFAVQTAIEDSLVELKHTDGLLPFVEGKTVGVQSCLTHLNENLTRSQQ